MPHQHPNSKWQSVLRPPSSSATHSCGQLLIHASSAPCCLACFVPLVLNQKLQRQYLLCLVGQLYTVLCHHHPHPRQRAGLGFRPPGHNQNSDGQQQQPPQQPPGGPGRGMFRPPFGPPPPSMVPPQMAGSFQGPPRPGLYLRATLELRGSGLTCNCPGFWAL